MTYELTNGICKNPPKENRNHFWDFFIPGFVQWVTKLKFKSSQSKGAFFWDYSGYSYSGLGITENKRNFNFQNNAHSFWKQNTHGGGDLRTATSSDRKKGDRRGRPRWFSRQKNPKRTGILRGLFCVFRVNRIPSILFVLAIGSRMNGMIFC